MDRISQVKQAILELISKHKYLYEDDYSDLCYDLSSKEASAINDWIMQSFITVKKNGVGRKYKNKMENIVKHPSLSNQKKIKSLPKQKKLKALPKKMAFKEILADFDKLNEILAEKNSISFNTNVTFNGVNFNACLAISHVEKAKGLEVLSSLDEGAGMLFPFEKANHVSFHMGSVKFPIDIIFLMPTALGLKVAKIIHNAQPGTDEIWSCNDISHVLEVVGGSCKKYNIKLGDLCVIC